VEWPGNFDRKIDKDSPDDMKWICEKAQERAALFNIEGVDYHKTMGVVKNIIPAIASTNALISAACVNEAMKFINQSHPLMKNYYMYMGATSIHSHTYETEQTDGCMVCKVRREWREINRNQTLRDFYEAFKTENNLSGPTFVRKADEAGEYLHIRAPPSLAETCAHKFDMTN